MISTSDIVILVVASGALAVGVYRWHQNTQDVSAITIPASSRQVVEPAINAPQAPELVVRTIVDTDPVTEIIVPQQSEVAALSENIQDPSLGTHRVVSGDFLGKIAQQYGTDVDTLRELNGISGSLIEVGQEILYPL